ncbi:MAG: cytochrome c biogenesis protein CcsA [Bacteroidetes bacterium]|nr:cytochrome c biogenesis protein CcsA [Bacteroidota bacterium]
MDKVQFIGEHLMPGKLGHFFVITAFVMALFSCFSYWLAAVSEDKDVQGSRGWLLFGRNGFIIHSAAIVGIFATLFYVISNHLFEYHYAWRHSDLSLSPKYLLSCFWEGQEGSFLLWTFWDCVLGIVVMLTAKSLESRTMTIISLVQVALTTMVLGFYFGDSIKIGSNPFLLLREQMQGAPIFAQPNYLEFVKDGNGLNILLQNYWMVIHPPVLFLGFASTIVPFAYTIAALWKGEYQKWIKPTWCWSLFSGAVLGTGIMMGGAWAYESLSFGGYWAWDPVENASLVPWLVLVGGLHTIIIFKATGRSLVVTTIFFILAYLLVWYSTFLTRTGILGDTSVHAFTDEGKSLYWHLLIVIGVLVALSIAMLIKRWKTMPRVKTEEAINSREFWMFIGSFILLLSAVQIIITTSIPVWSPMVKSISGKDVAPPADPVQHYNSIQVWVAFILCTLMATILYLRFKSSDNKLVWKRLGITAAIALVMALIVGYLQRITTPQYDLMLFGCCYTIVGMVYYAISIQKLKFKKLGPATSHLGFGLLMLAILISSYNKHAISLNTTGERIGIFDDKSREKDIKENMEHVMMFKNVPMTMGDYTVTYKGDSTISDPEAPGNIHVLYKVLYEHLDTTTKQAIESFTLYPEIVHNANKQMNNGVANPASRHYLSHDVFTYLTPLNDTKKDTAQFRSHEVKPGDTIFISNGYIVFTGLDANVSNPNYHAEANDVAVSAKLDVYDLKGKVGSMQPVYYIRDKQYVDLVTDTLKDLDMYARVQHINPETKTVDVQIKQDDPKDDFIVIKTLIFPYINLVWLGVIVMVLGFLLSLYNRLTKKEKEKASFTEGYPFSK